MSKSTSSLSRSLRQLLLWLPILAILLGLLYWDLPMISSRGARLRFVGNATNLFAVAVPEVANGEADADDRQTFTYRRLDPRRRWSDEMQGRGRPLAMTAWQEDLVVQFSSGGIHYYGETNVYSSPAAQPWHPVALASEGSLLLAFGATQNSQAVFSRRGNGQWGEVETPQIDLAPQEQQSTALRRLAALEIVKTARAATADGYFHVVWQTAVSETPIDGARQVWLLHHLWRDNEGQWAYAALPELRSRQQVGLAATDGRLIMVYVDEPGGRVRRAQFVPETARWNVLGDLNLEPAKLTHEAVTGVDLTVFEDNLIVVLQDDQNQTQLWTLDVEQGTLSAPIDVPQLTVKQPAIVQVPFWQEVASMVVPGVVGLLVLMYAWSRERRSLVREVAEGRITAEEAARQAGMSQLQRIAYLPVLLRRIIALAIDLTLMGMVAVILLAWLLGQDVMVFVQQESLLNDIRHLMYWQLLVAGLMSAYGFVTESLWGRTIGKQLLGLHVVSMTGGRAAWHQILLRNILRPLDMSIRGAVGLFLVLWSPRNQRIGDIIGDTLVQLRRREPPRQ